MTDWKEQAHLFCNGKFKADTEKLTSIKNDVWDICGVYRGALMLERGSDEDFEHFACEVEDCTLIARPIEDMTEEEHDMWTRKRYNGSEGLFESPCSFNYLLSIGCLPKIWEYCFENGTVIDATKLQEAV